MNLRIPASAVACTFLLLLTGCAERVPPPDGYIEAQLVFDAPSYVVEWADIEGQVDAERLEPIFLEAIEADGAVVWKIVEEDLAVDFNRVLNEQYRRDGQEQTAVKHLSYQVHFLEITSGLFG